MHSSPYLLEKAFFGYAYGAPNCKPQCIRVGTQEKAESFYSPFTLERVSPLVDYSI